MTICSEFFRQQDVHLPPWADYSVSQWRAQDRDVIQEILALRLGWDLTRFGAADFMQTGLTQFTLRNGSPGGQPWHKPYAEKIMHVREGQLTPMHYHPRKMEDIINRGGGRAQGALSTSAPGRRWQRIQSRRPTPVSGRG